jgi:hypothetical protein
MKRSLTGILGWWAVFGMLMLTFYGCGGSDKTPSASDGSMASTDVGSTAKAPNEASGSGNVPLALPATPLNITAGASQSKTGLSWTASAGVAGYRVSRDGLFLAFVTTPSFLDVGLNASTQYCYSISAVDAEGNESLPSAPVCLTTLAVLDAAAPVVLSTSPASLAVNVQTDPLTISAVFSEAMNVLSVINALSFTVSGVQGTLSYEAATSTVTFTPSITLTPGTMYTATISGNAADVAGNRLGADHVWSFTTTAAPVVTLPAVVSTNPANNGINVSVTSVITAVFSEPMDPLTVMNPSCFTVNHGVAGIVSYDIPSRMAILSPSAPLAPATTYTGTICNNVQDIAGNKMTANHAWNFTTAP